MNKETTSSTEKSIETEGTDFDGDLIVDGQDSLSIVGIGASAGGLEALQEMVKNLKPTGKAAYIIAQHLSPTYKSMMVDLLSKDAGLPITEAQHNHPLEADIIYVCPPNNNIAVRDDKIKLSKPEAARHGPKPNIDILFESIAESKGSKAIGVILSGTGSDGARGIRIIKSEAGFTFVQIPAARNTTACRMQPSKPPRSISYYPPIRSASNFRTFCFTHAARICWNPAVRTNPSIR